MGVLFFSLQLSAVLASFAVKTKPIKIDDTNCRRNIESTEISFNKTGAFCVPTALEFP